MKKEEQFPQGADNEYITTTLEQPDNTEQEGMSLEDEIKNNARDANSTIQNRHSGWRDISNEVKKYLQERDIKIEDYIKDLLDRQTNELQALTAEQDAELATVRDSTREKLIDFFSASMKQIYKGAKAGFEAVPDIQQLVDNLGIKDGLEPNSITKMLITFLNFVGGVRSYSVETGIISKDPENNNALQKIIGGVNSFLQQNETSKSWLQKAIARVTTKK